GVAAAIAIGGPGALFWMWVTALVGMATKYAEAVLAVSYRERDADGRTVGGPMYYIRNGMGPKWAWLGGLFATFGVFASFGTGNYIQAVSVADVMNTNYGVAPIVTGLAMLALAAAVILGGVKRIANVASKLVPAMAGAYMLAGLIIIAMNLGEVPGAFGLIVQRAFGFDAAAGGFVGALFWLAMQKGVARGIFSNEAGQGSAPIAHAAAKTNDPVDQGLVAMLGTFIDTLVVCTVTGLVILTTNVIPPECNALAILSGDALAAACDTGAPVTAAAFGAGLPGVGGHVVAIGLALFAFTTILGWSYYGERCAEFLFGERAVTPYRLIYLAIIPLAAMALYATGSDGDNDSVVNLIWLAVDTLTGLMAVPNLIALAALSPFIITLTRGYFRAKAEGRAQAFIDETVADRPRGGPAT
ncbi:MAG: alanine/glycine:cation symporter family protein, partial [Pseudomonadota bacterium]